MANFFVLFIYANCAINDIHLMPTKYIWQDFHGRVPGVKAECVDATGAGDSFVGGVLNSLASNPDLYKVMFWTFSF